MLRRGREVGVMRLFAAVGLCMMFFLATNSYGAGRDGPDASERPVRRVRPFHVKLGLGKMHSIGGLTGLVRPTDVLGIEFGGGAALGTVTYQEWGGSSETEFHVAPIFGAGPNFYFTKRTRPNQHSINLRGAYSEMLGGVGSIGYGYERHPVRGVGFEVGAGLRFAPDYEDRFIDYVDFDEDRYDVDDIWFFPVYIEIGIIF